MKECWLKPFEVKHFLMKHLETEKRPKKEKKTVLGFIANYRESHREIKTSVVVCFTSILPNKKLHHGRLLLRLYGKVAVMVFFFANAVAQKC